MWSSSSHIATGIPVHSRPKETPSSPRKWSKNVSSRFKGYEKVGVHAGVLRRTGNITSLLPKVHGQPLKGYSPCGRKGSKAAARASPTESASVVYMQSNERANALSLRGGFVRRPFAMGAGHAASRVLPK